jgi:hypothetical protein
VGKYERYVKFPLMLGTDMNFKDFGYVIQYSLVGRYVITTYMGFSLKIRQFDV